MLSVYMSLVVIGYFREQLDRRRIRSAFAQYLSPTLVERLAKSPKQLVLGGEDRVMTVLFSDVRGFTTIAETYKDNPNGLTSLMNCFLTPLTNEIIARNGTIDKYIGELKSWRFGTRRWTMPATKRMHVRQRWRCSQLWMD